MKRVITFFIKYPTVVNLIMFLVFTFGTFGYLSLRSTFFPSEDVKFINIDLVFRGASPQELEEGVVTKIEDNLKSVTGIDRVTSVSRENSGNIQIELAFGFDPDKVLQDVQNAVDRINTFPVGLEPPVVYKEEIENISFTFALSGNVDLISLRKAAQEVENDLRSQPGISKVYFSGFPEQEIEIAVNESALQRYGITFDEIVQAVRNTNIELTAGSIKNEEEEISIRARAKEYYSGGLLDVIVRSKPDGSHVFLKDVAEIHDQFEDVPVQTFLNRQPSVTVSVFNTNEEDILKATEFLRSYIDEFNGRNELISATLINDRSISLRQRIQLLQENGIIGAILVFVFLAFSLNIRLSFWTAVGIPFCFFLLFTLAPFYGLTINVLSLFGMIIVVGILVDDGIVVTENIFQHYERGKSALEAAVDGTLEVLPSITSAIITTVLAFSFFFFIEGRLGEFFSDIAFVVIVTLVASLVECTTVLPSHIAHSKALHSGYKMGRLEKFFTSIILKVRDGFFAPMARFALDNPIFSLAVPISLFIITMGGFAGGLIKTTFFPNIEQESISVNLEMPIGTVEDRTLAVLSNIERHVDELNERYKAVDEDGKDLVVNVVKSVGPQSNQGKLDVYLLNAEERTQPAFEVAGDLRNLVGPIYEAKTLVFGQLSPFGKPVSIALTSTNLDELQNAKEWLKEQLRQRPALRDVTDNEQIGKKEIDITLKDAAHQLGLSLGEIIRQVRQGFFGQEIQSLQRGVDEVKVWVRYGKDERKSVAQLEDMRIRTPQGLSVPLRELVNFEQRQGIVAINHLDGQRQVLVEADVANLKVSVTDEVAEIGQRIMPELVARYPTIRYGFEGQSRTAAKSAASASTAGPVLLLLMISVAIFNFRSFVQGITIFLLAPFAIIGVGWGHVLHGMPISIFSMLGIIALTGVLINDSLVYVNTLNGYLKEGEKLKEALYQTSIVRFRPIVLTSLTTIAGLAPLMTETSFQAQFLIPMAVSLTYGLVMTTVMTLLLLPTLLLLSNAVRRRVHWLWHGVMPTPESVEPAQRELHNFD